MYGICPHGNELQFCGLCCMSTAMPIPTESLAAPLSPPKKGLVCACGCGKLTNIHGLSSTKDGVVFYFAKAKCQADWVNKNR